MAIIDETELIKALTESKNVLLIEPPYIRKYIPLGLAKISSFIKVHGGNVTYSRNASPGKFDLVCITTCFTTDSQIVLDTIKNCQRSIFLKGVRIIVGGIFASLMSKYLIEKTGADVFAGCSDILDSCLPDYSLNWGVPGFFGQAMTVFTTRGCPNKCGYCMVWKLEKNHQIIPSWKRNIEEIDREVCVISDNNLLSFPIDHLQELVDTLNKFKKKVIFNNGVDCKLINDENAKLLASLSYTHFGFRTAFDRASDDGHYQKAMDCLIKAGLRIKGNSYTYVLFNFDDTPQEAYYRARECWKYGSNPYLMRYRPLNLLQKEEYISPFWTKGLITAFSNYGQNFGYNRKDGIFETWVKEYSENGKWKYKSELTEEDWEKWNFKR